MSLVLRPVFESRIALPADTDFIALALEFEALDELAGRLGIPPITSFADNRAIPEGFDGDPEELADLLGPSTAWFSPQEALTTTRRLLAALSKKAQQRTFRMPESLVAELNALCVALEHAGTAGVRFRLELG